MTRRLEDLYALGIDLEIGDDKVDEEGNALSTVSVYLQKLSPAHQQRAFEKANAERAKVFAIKRRPESVEYLAVQADVFGMTRDSLIERLLAEHMMKRRAPIEAKFAEESDWNEEDYLSGLLTSWNGGLDKKLEENPEDVEAVRVREELDRFDEEVAEAVKHEEEEHRSYLEKKDEEDLQQRVTDIQLKLQADLAFLVEHRYSQVWLATREPDDHDKRYFETREDVDKLDVKVFRQLSDAYQALEVPADEGKD